MNLWIFSKNNFKTFNFMIHYKCREIPGEFYYLGEKFNKKLKKMAEIEDYCKWDENSWNFWRKSTGICRKMQAHQDLMNDFDWAQIKLSNPPAKLCTFEPKMKSILNIFKKILRFFDQNLYGKLTFSHFLLNISSISGSAPKI